MALPGERDHYIICVDCGSVLDYGVQHSNAGFYIGTWCPQCGPYGRESDYFLTRKLAEKEL